MTKGLPTIPTPQGGTAPAAPRLAHLYETRHGLFAGPRTLWNGGESPAPAPAPSPAPAPDPAPPAGGSRLPADALERLERLIARSGGSDRAAELLFDENRSYRARIRELEAAQPPQGSVTLTPEQAQQWQAYQQLGDDPAQLRTRLEQGSQAIEREQGRELAQVSGANPEILSDLLRVTGLRAEVREVPAQGSAPAKREVHLLSAEGQDQGELRAYVQQHRAAYVPALFPAATPQGGTVVSGQAGAGAGAGSSGLTSYADRVLAERQAAAQLNPTPVGGTV